MRIKALHIAFSLFLLLLAGNRAPVFAQTEPTSSNTVIEATPDKEGPFVTLDVKDALLASVLKQIEDQANISIVYRDELIDSIFVSLSIEQVPYIQAIDTLLLGKGIHMERLSEQQFVLINSAQDKAGATLLRFQGIIRDSETSKPLPGASIFLARSQLGLVANTEGRFLIQNVVIPSDTLLIRHLGYRPYKLPVRELETEALNEVHMSITPIQLPDGIVSDSLQQAISSGIYAGTYTVTPNELFEVPSSSSNSPLSILPLLPGIAENYSGTLNIRNGSSSQHLMLLDAIPLYFNTHTFGFSPTVSESLLESISLFKGGFPVSFGGATTGVIELLTRQGNYDRFQASLGVDALKAYSYINMPISGAASVQVAFQRSYSQLLESSLYRGIIGSSHGKVNADQQTLTAQLLPQWFNYSNLQVKGSYNPGPKDVLSVTYHQSMDDLQYAVDSRTEPNTFLSDGDYYTFEDNNLVENRGGAIQWNRYWSETARTEIAVSGSEIYDTYRSIYFQRIETDLEESNTILKSSLINLSAHLKQSLQFNSNQTVNIGLWYDSKTVGSEGLDTYSSTTENGNTPLEDLYNFDVRGPQVGGNAAYTWTSSTGIKGELGLRQTYDVSTKKNYLEPRLFLQYALSDQFSVQGSLGNYRQFLSKLQFLSSLDIGIGAWYLAEEFGEPIQSINRTIGLAWKNEQYQLNIEAYSNRMYNLFEYHYESGIEADSESYLQVPFSDINGWSKGIEFMAQKQTGPLRGRFAYTLSRTERQLDGINNNQRFLAHQDRTHQASILSQYKLGLWRLAMTWRFSSGRPFTEVLENLAEDPLNSTYTVSSNNALRLPSNHQMDFSIHRTFVLRTMLIEAGVTVLNVYNRENIVRRHYDDFSLPLGVTNYVSPGFTPTFSIKIIYP